MGSTKLSTVSAIAEDLRRDAVDRFDVHPGVAATAADATRRALFGQMPSKGLQARAEAYFWAVVRRHGVRKLSPDAASRFKLASVVADLRSAGRSPRDIWDELERGWSDKASAEVLQEYRRRLCA